MQTRTPAIREKQQHPQPAQRRFFYNQFDYDVAVPFTTKVRNEKNARKKT